MTCDLWLFNDLNDLNDENVGEFTGELLNYLKTHPLTSFPTGRNYPCLIENDARKVERHDPVRGVDDFADP